MAKDKKNNGKKTEDKLAFGRQIAVDLGISEHLEIFQKNGIRVDVERIGAPEYPSIEIFEGMVFHRVQDRYEAFLPIAPKHEHLWKDLAVGRRGDSMMDFAVNMVECWSRRDGKDTVLLDEDDQPRVQVATPLAFYREGLCMVPKTPIDGVVRWDYRDGRKTGGMFLPLDLERAEQDGWFSRSAAHVGLRTEVRLYPIIREERKGGDRKRKGGNERTTRIEQQAIHPSGMKIVSPFPQIVNWGDDCAVHLKQRGLIIFAVPLLSVGTEEAEKAIEESADSAELDVGDGVEEGPEEIRVGKGVMRSIWEVLAIANKVKGVEFEKIDVNSSAAQLRTAKRMVAMAVHPDKVQGRFDKISGVPAAIIAATVKQAGLQWAPLEAAFMKAQAIRDLQWEAVSPGIEELVLDAAALKVADKLKDGEDGITDVIGKALSEGFSWKNANHVGMRNRSLGTIRERLKAAEPPEQPPADPTGDASAPAPETGTTPPTADASPEAPVEAAKPRAQRPVRPVELKEQTTAKKPGEPEAAGT